MKMHGLGNDFVVMDLRGGQPAPTPALVAALADRHRGVGFDQLALVRASEGGAVDLTFYNTDGSVSAACGNATRCIAAHEMAATGARRLAIRTARGALEAVLRDDGITAVNMGAPQTGWREIPLAEEVDTAELPIEGGPVATGMGNPHCTFFVEDAVGLPLESFGPRYETHPLFPERANVEVVQVLSRDVIRMRIWERGVGATLASGSGACAAAVAAARRGLTERRVTVELDGGRIEVDWRDDGVWMAGPTAHVFTGTLTPEFLEGIDG